MDLDNFYTTFLQLAKCAMIEYERFPAVERIMELMVKFSVCLAQSCNENTNKENCNTEQPDDDMHPFLQRFFDFLLKVLYS